MTNVPNVDPVTALVLDRLDRFEVSVKEDIKEQKVNFEKALKEQSERIEKIENGQKNHNEAMNAFVNKWKGGAMALAGIGSVISYASGVLDPIIKWFSTKT